MSASPKASKVKIASNEDVSWISPKRNLRAQVDAARSSDSPASPTSGTFGGATRFNSKLLGTHGACSPHGKEYFKRSALFKNEYLEQVRSTSLGVGPRPDMIQTLVPPAVGPGSYKIVWSRAGRSSPLDGKEFCNTSLHAQLPSMLIPADNCSPGPHHRYDVARQLDAHLPKFHSQSLGKGGRHAFKEDMDQPGPGEYPLHHHTVAHSSSCPDFGGEKMTKVRTVKSTFGCSQR